MEFKTIGDRIKHCRLLAKLTRSEIERKYNLKMPTMVSYESNLRVPIKPKLRQIIEIFIKENVAVTSEWILSGTGQKPKYLNKFTEKVFEGDSLNMCAVDDLHLIYLEETHIYKKYKNVIIHTVTSRELEPLFYVGDRVAGVPIQPKSFNNLIDKVCIIKDQNERIYVKSIAAFNEDNSLNICGLKASLSDKNFFISGVKYSHIAPIFWIRRNLGEFKF